MAVLLFAWNRRDSNARGSESGSGGAREPRARPVCEHRSNPAGEARKSPETLSFLGFLLCDIFPNTTYVPHFVQEGLFLVNAFTAILIRIPILNEAFVPVFIRIGSNTFCGIPMVSCQCALGKRDKNERRCKSTRCMLFR